MDTVIMVNLVQQGQVRFYKVLKLISGHSLKIKVTVVSDGIRNILTNHEHFRWIEITIFVEIQTTIQMALGVIPEIHTNDGTTVTFQFVTQR